MSNKLMLWTAVTKNEIYNESDHSFDEIDKDNLISFHMSGLDTEFIHIVDTGQTYINENKLLFLLNDKLIGKSNDIINYKEAIKGFFNPNSNIDNNIIGYYTGWKEKNEDFSNIEFLYWVDMYNQEVKIRLTLTPANEEVLNSKFSIILNGDIHDVGELKFANINKKERFIFNIFEKEE